MDRTNRTVEQTPDGPPTAATVGDSGRDENTPAAAGPESSPELLHKVSEMISRIRRVLDEGEATGSDPVASPRNTDTHE